MALPTGQRSVAKIAGSGKGEPFHRFRRVTVPRAKDLPVLTAMTTTFIACGAALVAMALTAAVFLLGRRSDGEAEERLAALAAQVDERMEAMVRDLSEALERAQAENRRTRVLGELGGTIDLDEVLTRTLDATGAIAGVDAAVVSVTIEGDEPLVAAVGIGAGEPAATVSGPPDGATPRSIAITYEYGAGTAIGGREPIRAALAVPLTYDGERLGYLSAYSRSGAAAFGATSSAELEELALRAGPAIDNARRFREARQLADLDALTGLHNRRYFHETLAREVARAHRYSRSLALVVFDLDDFKAINDRIGHLAGDAVLAEASERVRDVVRSADVACRVGGDEFAVILPESSVKDADLLCGRLEHAISESPVGQAGRLHLSAGVTELQPEDDAVSFFERADEALYRAKGAGKGTVVSVDSVTRASRRAPGTATNS
jgi:diguanylate cyclase (GGDEF)-like protein